MRFLLTTAFRIGSFPSASSKPPQSTLCLWCGARIAKILAHVILLIFAPEQGGHASLTITAHTEKGGRTMSEIKRVIDFDRMSEQEAKEHDRS
jgi:hypothetical protein